METYPHPCVPAKRSALGVHRRASHGSQTRLFTPLKGKEAGASLREARSLTVHGDWTFADTVTVVGDAVLPDEGEPRTVDAEVIGQQ